MPVTFPVDTKDGRTVYVTLDKEPVGLKARNQAIDAALVSGRFSPDPPSKSPTAGSMTLDLARTAVDYGAPMAGIGLGMARGAALGGAIGGPPGAVIGGVGGAALGGITGYAGREAVDLGSRLATGQAPRPTADVLRDVVLGGGRAGIESTPPGAVVGGIGHMLSGDIVPGAAQAGLGLLGLPQTGRMLGIAANSPRDARGLLQRLDDAVANNLNQSGVADRVRQRMADRLGIPIEMWPRSASRGPVMEYPAITEQTAKASVREATAKAADRLGITLSAAEQSGTPFLESAEAVLMRTGGSAGRFRQLGQRQNIQGSQAMQDVATQTTGSELTDAAQRGNTFAMALRDQLAGMKKLRNTKETDFVRAAGADSPVDVTDLVKRANALLGEMPALPSLQNSRLRTILEDIRTITEQRVPATGSSITLTPRSGTMPGQIGALGEELNTVPIGPTARMTSYPTTAKPHDIATGQEIPRVVTLSELRRIRTALGEMAFPDRGAIPDVPKAQAQQLWGAATDVLDQFAQSKGPDVLAKWQEATETSRRLHATTDSSWYAQILSDKRNLADFSGQMFNPRNLTMLQDAKTLTSDGGWKMIQQQWFDDAFRRTQMQTPDGVMVLGKKFADHVFAQRPVLKELFGPEAASAIEELGGVLRVADPTMSVTRNRAFTTGLVEYFQSKAVAGAVTGASGVASAATAGTLPWLLGKVLTNPTTARMIAGAAKGDTLGASTAQSVVDFLLKSGAIANNPPSPEPTE